MPAASTLVDLRKITDPKNYMMDGQASHPARRRQRQTTYLDSKNKPYHSVPSATHTFERESLKHLAIQHSKSECQGAKEDIVLASKGCCESKCPTSMAMKYGMAADHPQEAVATKIEYLTTECWQ